MTEHCKSCNGYGEIGSYGLDGSYEGDETCTACGGKKTRMTYSEIEARCAALEKERDAIREYAAGGEAQSAPCPLCKWDNGTLIEECCAHRTTTRLESQLGTLREALQKSEAVVEELRKTFGNVALWAAQDKVDALLAPKGGKDGQTTKS